MTRFYLTAICIFAAAAAAFAQPAEPVKMLAPINNPSGFSAQYASPAKVRTNVDAPATAKVVVK